jgi:hypothetical protein
MIQANIKLQISRLSTGTESRQRGKNDTDVDSFHDQKCLYQSLPSHHERQPKRCLQDRKRGQTREIQAKKSIQCPKAPGFGLGDGNADKEAEKLIPSPNFCVHRGLFKEMNLDGQGFYTVQWLCNQFPHQIITSKSCTDEIQMLFYNEQNSL